MANFQSIELISQHTWTDIIFQNREVLTNFIPYIQVLNEDIEENQTTNSIVQKEIAGSIVSEARKDLKEAEKRILYEFNCYTEDDIKFSKLTEIEVKILQLRRIHNRYIKVADILDVAPQSVYKSYLKAITKIENYRKYKLKGNGSINLLSNQQKKIYELLKKGKKNKDIAEILELGPHIVKTQKSRMKKRGYI